MEYFKLDCPHCHEEFEAPEDMLGEVVQCPSCEKTVQLPNTEQHEIKSASFSGVNSPTQYPEHESEKRPLVGNPVKGCGCFVVLLIGSLCVISILDQSSPKNNSSEPIVDKPPLTDTIPETPPDPDDMIRVFRFERFALDHKYWGVSKIHVSYPKNNVLVELAADTFTSRDNVMSIAKQIAKAYAESVGKSFAICTIVRYGEEYLVTTAHSSKGTNKLIVIDWDGLLSSVSTGDARPQPITGYDRIPLGTEFGKIKQHLSNLPGVEGGSDDPWFEQVPTRPYYRYYITRGYKDANGEYCQSEVALLFEDGKLDQIRDVFGGSYTSADEVIAFSKPILKALIGLWGEPTSHSDGIYHWQRGDVNADLIIGVPDNPQVGIVIKLLIYRGNVSRFPSL